MTESTIETTANAMLALERENSRPSHLDYASAAIDAAYPLLTVEIERLKRELEEAGLREMKAWAERDQYLQSNVKLVDEIKRLRKETERLRDEIEAMKEAEMVAQRLRV